MKLSTLALAGALALTGATASFAQPAAPAPPGERPGAMRMQRPDPAQMAERRAEHLRAALQLRPEQDAALRAFIDAQRPPERLRDRMRGQGPAPDQMTRGQMTTPQRLEQARERMARRQAKFDRRAQATLRFYAQLSPAQQKAFDALAPMGGGRHMKRGGGMHRGGMGHGRG